MVVAVKVPPPQRPRLLPLRRGLLALLPRHLDLDRGVLRRGQIEQMIFSIRLFWQGCRF